MSTLCASPGGIDPDALRVGDRFTRDGACFEVVHVTPIGPVVASDDWRWPGQAWRWMTMHRDRPFTARWFAGCVPLEAGA